MKRILLVVDEFLPLSSAQAMRIHSFAKELKKDYEVEILCGEQEPSEKDKIQGIKYKTIQRPTEKEPIKFLAYFLKFNQKILSMTQKRKYDLVIITIPRYEFLYAINRLKTPYILDIRDLLVTKNYEVILQRFMSRPIA